MKPFRVSFLVNPISGGGRGRELYDLLSEVMLSFGFGDDEWSAELTERENGELQIARLAQQSDRLIAVGGDGTMNALLSERVLHPDEGITVGLIPLGTGNDLARVLGIYQNYASKGLPNTLRKLVMSHSHLFDVWRLSDKRMMAAYCSVGLDAKIAEQWNADRSSGRIPFRSDLLKKGWYLPIFAKTRSDRLPKGCRLRWVTPGGAIRQTDLAGHCSAIISNIPSYAGGAHPFGSSSYSDGQIEILFLPTLFRFALAMTVTRSPLLARWFKGLLKTEAAREVDLFVPQGVSVQVDGEGRSEELSGDWLRIRHAGQLRLLALKS